MRRVAHAFRSNSLSLMRLALVAPLLYGQLSMAIYLESGINVILLFCMQCGHVNGLLWCRNAGFLYARQLSVVLPACLIGYIYIHELSRLPPRYDESYVHSNSPSSSGLRWQPTSASHPSRTVGTAVRTCFQLTHSLTTCVGDISSRC